MDQDATWYGHRPLGPRHIVLDGDPAPPTPKKGGTAPYFQPMSIVARLLPISAAAEHLYSRLFTEYQSVILCELF